MNGEFDRELYERLTGIKPVDVPLRPEEQPIEPAPIIQPDLPPPPSTPSFKDQLSSALLAKGIGQASQSILEGMTGTKGAEVDYGVDTLRKSQEDERKFREALALAEQKKKDNAANLKSFQKGQGGQVRKGKYEGVSIDYDPNSGMYYFLDPFTGEKVFANDPDIEKRKAFIDPKKTMVEMTDERRLKMMETKLQTEVDKTYRPSDKQTEALANADELVNSLNRADALFNSGDIDIGEWEAGWQNFKEKYVPFAAKNEKFAQLQATTGSVLADYVKSLSGAAVSEKEADRLAKIVPNVNDQPSTFKAKMGEFRLQLKRSVNAYLNSLEAQGKKFDAMRDRMTKLGLYDGPIKQQEASAETKTPPTFPVVDPGIQALADKKGWTYDRAKAALIKAGKIKE